MRKDTYKFFSEPSTDWRVIKLDWEKLGMEEMKAGTPLDIEGNIANNADVFGILMDDVDQKRNTEARVVIAGWLDTEAAAEHCGIKLSGEAKTALEGIRTYGGGGASHWDDLEGKPFGDKSVVETVLLEETEFVILEGSGSVKETLNVEIGKDYNVYYNGEKYVCTAFVHPDMVNDWAWTLGNMRAFNWEEEPDTGEPFFVVQDNSKISVGVTNEDWYPKIKITQTTETTTPIPKELLPEPLRFGEEVSGFEITWDGNTDGLVCVADMLYKVSDETPKLEQLYGAKFVTNTGHEMTFTEEGLSEITYSPDGNVLFPVEGLLICYKANIEVEGIHIPEAGVYFMSAGGTYATLLSNEHTVITPIDEKYLPESVKGGSGGDFVIYVTHDGSGKLSTSDKAFAEIREALKAQKNVRLIHKHSDGYHRVAYLDEYEAESADTSAHHAIFQSYYGGANYLHVIKITVFDAEPTNWTYKDTKIFDNRKV